VLGDDNWIGSHATVGGPPAHPAAAHDAWDAPESRLPIQIGSRNRIRHTATITHGMVRATRVGNDCMIMGGSVVVAHDMCLEDGVTIAAGANFGGYVVLGRGTNIGLGVAVHQRLVLGAYVMVGMNATVTRDIPPFALAYGTPARVVGANRVGMARAGFDPEEVELIDAHYRAAPGGSVAEPLSERATEVLTAHAERVLERDRL